MTSIDTTKERFRKMPQLSLTFLNTCSVMPNLFITGQCSGVQWSAGMCTLCSTVLWSEAQYSDDLRSAVHYSAVMQCSANDFIEVQCRHGIFYNPYNPGLCKN